MPVDYEQARVLLVRAIESAERTVLTGAEVEALSEHLLDSIEVLFESKTQAFREVLLGCLLVRMLDGAINVRMPYVSQGAAAYNGRTLDERVVNPLLQEKRIPASNGPFLSVFRRSVEFNASTREGIRDKSAYDAFLIIIAHIERTANEAALALLLNYVAYRFVLLREAANVPVTRIQRMSLDQTYNLVSGLLRVASGGRLSVYIVVSILHVIKKCHNLDWVIKWEGINVSDAASGAGGDIEVLEGEALLLTAEVTERTVGANRVVSTFNTKIGPQGIEEYLFFVNSNPSKEALRHTQQYFAQGHEVNFVLIAEWMHAVLATLGGKGRSLFLKHMIGLLESSDTPAAVKTAWNENVNSVVSG